MVNIWIKNRISIILRQTFNSKIMKKTLFTLIALLLMSVGTMWGTEKVENKNVIINKDSSKDMDKEHPRSLIGVPIICTYQNGFLFFTFLEDLGEMEITVTNPSLGVVSVSEYDSAYGSVAVPASSESGSYLIEIVTETGEYYYGEYTL